MWQRAHELGSQLLAIAKEFPRTDEARIVKNQLLRAGLSISANIAEGFGGLGGKSFANYATIARRSASETENWLLVAKDAHYLSQTQYVALSSLNRECIAMLSSLMNRLRP